MDALYQYAVPACLNAMRCAEYARTSDTPLTGAAGTALRCNPQGNCIGPEAFLQEMLQARCGLQLVGTTMHRTPEMAILATFDAYQRLRGRVYDGHKLRPEKSDILSAVQTMYALYPHRRGILEVECDADGCYVFLETCCI
jgi:hypothetical protein